MEGHKRPKIGMIFPGQGSQSLGMGKDLYDRERLIQEYFEQASQCLDTNFVRLCFASSERELKDTVNAQTAIFLLSAAIFALLKEKYDITPDVVAGHSSGEYAALFAAGGVSFPDALYLLKKRSTFMEEATHAFPGTMMAVIGVPIEVLREICAKYDDPDNKEAVVQIVNYNSPSQLVISGTLPYLDYVEKDIRVLGGKVIPLNVAGGFHSRLMEEAEKLFSLYMVKVDFKDLAIPLINNVQARVVTSNDEIKESLVRQMSQPVLWWPAMEQLHDCDVIIEVGPGGKLAKMLKREWPDKDIYPLNSLTDLEVVLTRLGKDVEKSELALDLETEGSSVAAQQPAVEDQNLL